jgi:RimJ/RimL family protein N-acetyltransferase
MVRETGVQVRHARVDDVHALLELHLALDRETTFMLLEPGERSTDEHEQRERLDATLARPNQTVLVAEANSRLVGFVALLGGPYRRNRHNAYLVLGVLEEFGGRGVGTALLARGMKWAEKAGITRLELTVMAHNERAIRLYERMGFEREGIRRRALRVDGEWVDELFMALLLTPEAR